MIGARRFIRRDAKIARTPVYGFDSACRGPYTLKKRMATVGIRYACPVMRHKRSWSYFESAYTDCSDGIFVSGVATGSRGVPSAAVSSHVLPFPGAAPRCAL